MHINYSQTLRIQFIYEIPIQKKKASFEKIEKFLVSLCVPNVLTILVKHPTIDLYPQIAFIRVLAF